MENTFVVIRFINRLNLNLKNWRSKMTAYEDQVVELLKQMNRNLAAIEERDLQTAAYIEEITEMMIDVCEQLAKR